MALKTTRYIKSSHKNLLHAGLSLCIISVLLLQAPAVAITPEERRSKVRLGIAFIDEKCAYGSRDDGIAPGSIDLNTAETANAKTIIGIAKTYNLGRQGALIGLVAALARSNLQNYANSRVPLSQENPVWKALAEPRPLGNKDDSLGIMQLGASRGWSTLGTSNDSREVVYQLMNPAYAAQAFFGAPAGATVPSPLSKWGLQRIDGWQTSTDPAAIAKQVFQMSLQGAPGGQTPSDNTNYERVVASAENILAEHWDASPELPLPIAVSGLTAASNNQQCLPATPKDAILQKIAEYAWPDYCAAGSSNCRCAAGAKGCEGYNSPVSKKSAYQTAVGRAKYAGNGCYGGGVDCGGFVTIVMRESKADPDYNTNPQGNTAQQQAYLRRNSGVNGKYLRVTSEASLQPGDIAVRNNGTSGHTFIYVGNMKGEDGGEFFGSSGSASECGRAPMASTTDTFKEYEWYRLVRPEVESI
ncbi:MAG TPA: hypothetical protein VIS56_00555 [Candidatus Saccharimonadales bacterium]